MAQSTFDKKIILNRKALKNLSKTHSITKKQLGDLCEPEIINAEHIKDWFYTMKIES